MTNLPQDTINKIQIRMYRPGTGDFFVLKFMHDTEACFTMMIDCGCIQGSSEIFTPLISDLKTYTDGEIDLLVVTHEHADHINGFKIMSDELSTIKFKRVWFSWTESRQDSVANEYRDRYTKMKMALNHAATQLNQLIEEKYYTDLYAQELTGAQQLASQKHFVEVLDRLNSLNFNLPANGKKDVSTMGELLTDWGIIKSDTIIEYLLPGELRQKISGLPGINIFVLGPPKDLNYLSLEEKTGENFQKRSSKSTVELAMVNALNATHAEWGTVQDPVAFDPSYETADDDPITKWYARENWRNIDHDWLLGAGALALKLQQCINNTSLALAIQFQATEEVLLFPGDAEFGNWQSWHDKLNWQVTYGEHTQKVDAEYLLQHTIFYKVSHHLSQNGTPTSKGIQLMSQPKLVAMATLDLNRIMSGWLNTMPNDLLSAALIARTGGNVYFSGSSKDILKNIETSRVNVSEAHRDQLKEVNGLYEGKIMIDLEIMAGA